MKHGFSFDTDLCVGCKACTVACTLENGFQTGTRSINTYNNSASSELVVLNLSLACNHCEDPACLTGCPAKAYSRDSETGAIIHDSDKCMGCSFCTWRCPFDAPKMNLSQGYIEKCNFCIHRLNEGIDPACVTACPTGALSHIQNNLQVSESVLLPKTELNPSLIISGKNQERAPEIYPVEREELPPLKKNHKNVLRKEWSLIAFSALITVAAGFTFARFIGGTAPGNISIAVILTAAIILSFIHLGKITKAWRAIINTFSSPLSREICIVTLFATLAIIRLFYFVPAMNIIIVLAALLSLIAVDLVYLSTDKSSSVMTHSGQTLFSALLIASYFSSSMKLFSLLTFLAVASAVFRKGRALSTKTGLALFFIRQLLLLLPLLSSTLKLEIHVLAGQIIVLAGVLTDRVLFYFDFSPENIRDHIQNLAITDYEKERS